MKDIFSNGMIGDSKESINIRQMCEEYYHFKELSKDENLSIDEIWNRFIIYLKIKEIL